MKQTLFAVVTVGAFLVCLFVCPAARAEEIDSCPNFLINQVQDPPGIFVDDCDWDFIADKHDNCPIVKNGDCDTNPLYCDVNEDDSATEKEISAGYQADWNNNDIGDACEDSDLDGVIDYLDNCPVIANTDQLDSNKDEVGDACTDTDNDGYYDPLDNCPDIYNTPQMDNDADGIGDACDNCRFVYNPDQLNWDDDRRGDACAVDFDGDGISDDSDNCPETPNALQLDTDSDSVGDVCDNCPFVPNTGQLDTNNNNVGDSCDSRASITPQPGTSSGSFKQGSGGCSMVEGSRAAGALPVFGIFILMMLLMRRPRKTQ